MGIIKSLQKHGIKKKLVEILNSETLENFRQTMWQAYEEVENGVSPEQREQYEEGLNRQAVNIAPEIAEALVDVKRQTNKQEYNQFETAFLELLKNLVPTSDDNDLFGKFMGKEYYLRLRPFKALKKEEEKSGLGDIYNQLATTQSYLTASENQIIYTEYEGDQCLSIYERIKALEQEASNKRSRKGRNGKAQLRNLESVVTQLRQIAARMPPEFKKALKALPSCEVEYTEWLLTDTTEMLKQYKEDKKRVKTLKKKAEKIEKKHNYTQRLIELSSKIEQAKSVMLNTVNMYLQNYEFPVGVAEKLAMYVEKDGIETGMQIVESLQTAFKQMNYKKRLDYTNQIFLSLGNGQLSDPVSFSKYIAQGLEKDQELETLIITGLHLDMAMRQKAKQTEEKGSSEEPQPNMQYEAAAAR